MKLLFIVLCLLLHAKASSQDIVLAADYYCPLNCTPNTASPGYSIEIITKIFAPYGIKVVYKNMPWQRALALAKRGEIDGVIGALKAEAPQLIFPKTPLSHIANHLFVKQHSRWQYVGIDSLMYQRLGVISGYSYGQEIDQYIIENNGSEFIKLVSGNSGVKTNIRKLLRGRIDVYVEDSQVMNYVAKELGIQSKIKSAGVSSTKPIYIAFSPQSALALQFVQIFDHGFEPLKASGELNAILAKYGVNSP